MDDGIEEQVDALIDKVDREFKAINTGTFFDWRLSMQQCLAVSQ